MFVSACSLTLSSLYTTAGDANGNFKVNDLNVEADATAEDEDDIDWEEG